MLSDRKIVVAAGHCDPSRELLEAAIDAGLSMFTHLGNGCPLTLERHDNIIQRVLSLSDRLWCSFIADGVHVPWWVLKNYLKTVGPARTIIVSDCMAACRAGAGTYRLGRTRIVVGADGVSRSSEGGYLAGSTIDLAESAARLRTFLGWGDQEVALATQINPRKALGMELS
jgi:N-acetylglucosamine-6-phosphate deacetylase